MKSAAGGLDEAVQRAVEVKGVKVLTHRADLARARPAAHAGRQPQAEARRRSCGARFGAARRQGRDHRRRHARALTKRIQAGKLVGAVAKFVGGSGGGKPDIAEAGGKDQSQIDAALKSVPEIVGSLLA